MTITEKKRKKKKDVFYFSHDANARRDAKMIALRNDYGYAGIGKFWCLVEILREHNGYYELTKTNKIALEMEFQMAGDELAIFLKSLFGYKLLVKEHNKIYSPRLLECINYIEECREKRSKAGTERWRKDRENNSDACALQLHSMFNAHELQDDANKSKENKIKAKKNKEKKRIINERELQPTMTQSLDEFPDDFNSDTSKTAIKAKERNMHPASYLMLLYYDRRASTYEKALLTKAWQANNWDEIDHAIRETRNHTKPENFEIAYFQNVLKNKHSWGQKPNKTGTILRQQDEIIAGVIKKC